MAGFFGMFNYAKEGPGVAKNAPKKRTFFAFMEIYGRKFWKLAIAGLLWAITALPIVTRGWADAGLTFITRNFSREKHAFIKEDFIDSIKKNRKNALIIGIINNTVTGIFIFNLIFTLRHVFPGVMLLFGWTPEQVKALGELDTMGLILMALSLIGYVTFTWMKYYIPFLMITFKLNMKQIYKNAFLFASANMPMNVLISLILIAVYGVLGCAILFTLGSGMNYFMITIVLTLSVSVIPGFRSLLIQFCIFPSIKKLIIDPYYAANPGADKKARRELNLEVEEDVPAEGDTPEEEPLFVDTLPQPEVKPESKTDKPARVLPRQYNANEMRRFNRQVSSRNATDDDDDTI